MLSAAVLCPSALLRGSCQCRRRARSRADETWAGWGAGKAKDDANVCDWDSLMTGCAVHRDGEARSSRPGETMTSAALERLTLSWKYQAKDVLEPPWPLILGLLTDHERIIWVLFGTPSCIFPSFQTCIHSSYLFFHLSIHLSICPSVCPSVRLSVHLSIIYWARSTYHLLWVRHC